MRYLRFFGILSKVTGNEPGEIQAAKSSRGQSYPGRKMDEHINTMKKQEVHIRGLRIGGGRSCICVPLTAKTLPLLDAELASLAGHTYDMIEWRADLFEEIPDRKTLQDILLRIRAAIGETPLLFTFRTKNEGGEGCCSGPKYRDLLLGAAASCVVDLVDVELFTAAGNAQVLVGELHLLGTAVIGSSHDFSGTPSAQEMRSRLCRMQELGMDITKIAVMPRTRQDVLTLLSVAVEMEEHLGDRPCVTMAMGPLGVLTRISGSLTGNAITFGTCGAASAPGQLPCNELADILQWTHACEVR